MLYTGPQIALSHSRRFRPFHALMKIVKDQVLKISSGRGGAITIKPPVYMARRPGIHRSGSMQLMIDHLSPTCLQRPYRSMKITDQIYQAVRSCR